MNILWVHNGKPTLTRKRVLRVGSSAVGYAITVSIYQLALIALLGESEIK